MAKRVMDARKLSNLSERSVLGLIASRVSPGARQEAYGRLLAVDFKRYADKFNEDCLDRHIPFEHKVMMVRALDRSDRVFANSILADVFRKTRNASLRAYILETLEYDGNKSRQVGRRATLLALLRSSLKNSSSTELLMVAINISQGYPAEGLAALVEKHGHDPRRTPFGTKLSEDVEACLKFWALEQEAEPDPGQNGLWQCGDLSIG